ncbi:MAG: GspE/PulE family protein [Patescibacteria group bacterium UBA2103]
MPDFRDGDQTLEAARRSEAEDITEILSNRYNLHYINLTSYPIDPEALRLVKEEEARATRIVPFKKEGKVVSIAFDKATNPNIDTIVQELSMEGLSVEKYLVSQYSIEKALTRYADLSNTTQSTQGSFSVSEGKLAEELSQIGSLSELIKKVEDLARLDKARKATSLLELLFAGSIALGASDIHLEPGEEAVRIRMRLTGMLTDITRIDIPTYNLLVSRIKILGGLKLNVRTRPQDGRFSIQMGSNEVEIRASVIPGAFGESVVMRILDPQKGRVSIENLGIPENLLSRIEKEIKKPNGMLLTTGPTGSGKTTALYAFLQKIYTPDIKIITIEDPVEYKLPGIVQTQVEADKYTFASGLRSTLRQDPDVIMVGEIRDAEVAETAIRASLTGHFVLSTLHTNSAAGTFPRLVNLGVDPKSFGSAINVAMGQRLIRTLDPEKTKEVPLEGEDLAYVEKVLGELPESIEKPEIPAVQKVPATEIPAEAYNDRIGIYEAIFMDDELAAFLKDNPSESEIKQQAIRQGSITMEQDGVLKALQGLTTIAEVRRVVGE